MKNCKEIIINNFSEINKLIYIYIYILNNYGLKSLRKIMYIMSFHNITFLYKILKKLKKLFKMINLFIAF